MRTVDTAPEDEFWNEQWNLHDDDNGIGCEFAWYATQASTEVKIGIIDTGIGFDHWDFGWPPPHQPDYKYGGGYDYADNDPFPYDYIGHGTSCAGIAGACTNNGIGVAGIAGGWSQAPDDVGAKLYALKIFRDDGWPTNDLIIARAIREGADPQSFGCQILSNSYGGYGYSEAVRSAINFAYRLGVSFVASKGNDGLSNWHYPSDYDNSWITAVASYGEDGRYCDNIYGNCNYTSNYGGGVDITAPGYHIYTTIPPTPPYHEGWRDNFGGTSALALMWRDP